MCLCGTASAGDFAQAVIEYQPAPGQFINNPWFNDPSRVLGPPLGGGTTDPDETDLVSLGGIGGSIIIAFDQTVMDDPRNPHGLDAIVFSNAFWNVGDPTYRFDEPTIIEISKDVNQNGQPDDFWYVIPGTHLPPVPTDSYVTQLWDNVAGNGTPPDNLAWYPDSVIYPWIGPSYSTHGFLLTPSLPDPSGALEVVWGYGELSPTLLLGDLSGATGSAWDNSLTDPVDQPGMAPECFYTVPDDPMVVGIDPYSGGGDAFDIAWAVVPSNGDLANIDGFDFIRLRTGQDLIQGPLGEVSGEIDAVADVRAVGDINSDDSVNGSDLGLLLGAWNTNNPCMDLNRDQNVDGADLGILLGNWDEGLAAQKAALIRSLDQRIRKDIR
ncbi:MAG: hypothetical protein ACF8GE_03520 [Phycisphaerales bacterium JB043]